MMDDEVTSNKEESFLANGNIPEISDNNDCHSTVSASDITESEVQILKTIPPPKDNSPAERQKRLKALIDAPCRDPWIPKHQRGPDYILPCDEYRTWKKDGATKLRPVHDEFNIEPMSVITAFRNSVKEHPKAIALSVKRNNKWIKWTYAQYLKDAEIIAKAFIKLGLKPFHGVGMLGFNAPEWVIAEFGAIFAGGVAFGIYPSNTAEGCHYVLHHSQAQFAVVENELQLQKILQVRDRLPDLKLIVQYCGKPNHPDVLSWEELYEIGQSVPDHFLERRIKGQAINQCCLLIYTSGTTGNPKGAMISQDTITYIVRLMDEISYGMARGSRLSYLPLNHGAGQIFDVVSPTLTEGEVCFLDVEALKGKMIDYLTEVRPEIFLAVPRIYEKIVEKLRDATENLSWTKRTVFNFFRKQVLNYQEVKLYDHRVPSLSSFLGFMVAEELIIRKVREKLGLDRCNIFIVGGAPTSPDVHRYFLSLNIMLREAFGLTESFGAISSELNVQELHEGSVGMLYKGIKGKILEPDKDGIGEICTWGRNVFMGYLNQEEETIKAIDNEGWLYSGDQGYLKGDILYVTGRIKELIITSGGENIAPAPIEENVKKELPIISNAMLIGDKRKFLSMLLTLKAEINLNTLRYTDELTPTAVAWCRSVGSSATTVTEILAPDEKVMNGIQKGIDRANKNAISNAQKIQKWIVLPKDFSIPEDEIGPTLKMKRHVIHKKYAEIIEKFYK